MLLLLKKRLATSLITLVIFASVLVIGSTHPTSFAVLTLPPYAIPGAYANYTGDGGFIAFMSGVSGNISYFVSAVLPNGSMDLVVTGNLSLGTELGIPTSNVSLNLVDTANSPKYFPAIPPAALLSHQIDFQNITCIFVKSSEITIPAGTFQTDEFQGTGVNGSVLNFWFDNTTGLALQMSG